jgi:hypothetical protein
MVKCKIAVVIIARFAFAAPAAFGQASILEPGAFEFSHPNEDVFNGGAPSPEAALVSTIRTRNAYAAIHSGSPRSDFNKVSTRYRDWDRRRRFLVSSRPCHNVDRSYSNRSQCAATAASGLEDVL